MTNGMKITNYHILIFLAIPYLCPLGLMSFPFFSVIARMKYIGIFYLVLLIVKNRVTSINKLAMSVSFFCIVLVTITALKETEVLNAVRLSLDMIFPILWAGKMLEINKRSFLKFLTYYYGIITALNYFLILLYPSGIIQTSSVNAMNLLGDDNKMVFTLIFGLAISLYYLQEYGNEKKKKVASLGYIILYLSGLVKIWAATGIVSMCIVILMWYFDNHSNLAKKIFTIRNIIIAVLVFFYLTVFTNAFSQGVFADFMVEVLHKSVTFSARTTLWSQAVSKIMKSLILGYGYGRESVFDFSFSGAEGILEGFSCHDGYLRLLLEGGLVLLFSYFLIYIVLYRTIKPIWHYNHSIHILVFSIAGFLLACVFEAEYTSFLLIVVLEILYYSGRGSRCLAK